MLVDKSAQSSPLEPGLVGNLLIFREKILDLRLKSVSAVEMIMYVHLTCINVNRKDVHASMISFN